MNESRIYSFLSISKKAGKLTAGYNNCENDIKNARCKLVIIAEDASLNTRNKFTAICSQRNITFVVFGRKEKLGSCIGRDDVSVMGIKDESMSRVVLNMMKQQ